MSDSHSNDLKQRLLDRLVEGEIDETDYERLLARIQQQSTTTGSAASDTPVKQFPALHSIGDVPTFTDALQLTSGSTLGKYTILEQLGRGGMGEVWKAHDTIGDRDVVIKVLPPELSRSPEEVIRVKESFRTVQALNHQYICPTYDLGQEHGIGYFLVMQYLEANTLRAFQRAAVQADGEFPFGKIKKILGKVAVALDYAHQQKVIHRDVKPENIMLSRDAKEVWLIDFGLAAEIQLSLARVSQVKMDRSGTHPYMAPEQWKGQYQDAKTDQYALAVVAYELLSGRVPFEGVDTTVLRQCVLMDAPAPIEGCRDAVNSALARALSKGRDDRFDSCRKFISALTSTPTATRRADSAAVSVEKKVEPLAYESNNIGMVFSLIPAGEFMMGSPESEEGRKYDEHQHRVRITKPYYMQTNEVTQGQWKLVMGTEPWKGHEYVKEGADYAASYISWEDAVKFCRKLSQRAGVAYRLPTEAEWEYACRAGTATAYSFGGSSGQLGEHGWFEDNAHDVGENYAHLVDQKRANGFRLSDMHGNVWEWCSDWHDTEYYKTSPVNDPQGPSSGSCRVVRGGSWDFTLRYCRSANRYGFTPSKHYCSLGFRVVRSSVQ